MKKILYPLSLLLLISCTVSNSSSNLNKGEIIDYSLEKEETSSQFDFEGNYDAPELKIDGIDNDQQWSNASPTISFGAHNEASVKLFRGEKGLFCYFSIVDEDIQVVGDNNGDDVTHGDSVEIYFDFKNDASNKVQNDDIQINIGAHGKTRIFVGNNGIWGSWNGLLDYSVKLDGTINNSSDSDKGYSIELMIPYAQVGIDKNATFGIALGHVGKGRDSTHDTLPYTWGGLVYEGNFVDPQSPAKYLVYYENNFYSRENLPVENITFNGAIIDQDNTPLSNVDILISDNENEIKLTSDDKGQYVIPNFDPNKNYQITFTKENYKTYTKNITSKELKANHTRYDLKTVLINPSIAKDVIIKGTVKNPSIDIVKEAKVSINDITTTSSSSGEFSLSTPLDNDLYLKIEKDGYRSSSKYIDILDLINKTEFDLGRCELYSPSSKFVYGGARGIQQINVEIYRGFEGINFTFKSNHPLNTGDHIELFIDTKSSMHGRDNTDYRIDFKGDGGIGIVNFGDGNNTAVSTSGIKNIPSLEGTTYIFNTYIPYAFLNVTASEIIGISCGMWNETLKDWDGWGYPGNGFDAYVAPEYTDQYARIGLDNGLYRAKDNNTFATRIYGTVLDENGLPTEAFVNGIATDNGTFNLYFINNSDVSITITKDGYNTQTFTYTKAEINGEAIKLEVQLIKAVCIVQGTCNVNGAKVYYQENPEIFTYVENNTYMLEIPTSSNAHIVFEKEGYKTVNKGIGKASLIAKAGAQEPFIYNCTMELL